MNFLSTVVSFLVALGVLIVFHELGHYVVARVCGVKVLRFSLGFGKVLWHRKLGRDATEWAVSAFPLGGYVKMLDEREGPVPADQMHRAFNRQPVGKRFAIVAAGPIANFLLAILLYWVLFMHGVPGVKPVLGEPLAETPAARAQLAAGDTITRIGESNVATWQDVRWVLLEHALRKEHVTVEVHNARGGVDFRKLDLSQIGPEQIDADLIRAIGLTRFQPAFKPVIGKLITGGAGERDGLKPGDEVIAADGEAIASWDDLVALISEAPGRPLSLRVLREDVQSELVVTPDRKVENGKTLGRIGAYPHIDEQETRKYLTEVRYGPVAAMGQAAGRTWEVSVFTVKMLGRMIMGDVSLKNLSGPITIADYAGQSAQLGWLAYVSFLALISISLGVLNLMPVPLLDGGHLMYYVAEIVKGSPVSDRVMEMGQQVGIVLLFSLMAFALYNDINRLFGG